MVPCFEMNFTSGIVRSPNSWNDAKIDKNSSPFSIRRSGSSTTFHTGRRKPRMSLKVVQCSVIGSFGLYRSSFLNSKKPRPRPRAGQWTAGRRRCQLSWAAPKLSERTSQRHASRENVYTTTNFKAKIPIFIIRLFLLFNNFEVRYKSNYLSKSHYQKVGFKIKQKSESDNSDFVSWICKIDSFYELFYLNYKNFRSQFLSFLNSNQIQKFKIQKLKKTGKKLREFLRNPEFGFFFFNIKNETFLFAGNSLSRLPKNQTTDDERWNSRVLWSRLRQCWICRRWQLVAPLIHHRSQNAFQCVYVSGQPGFKTHFLGSTSVSFDRLRTTRFDWKNIISICGSGRYVGFEKHSCHM